MLGDEAARDFLVEVLALAQRAVQHQLPVALVADETRALLARRLQGRRGEFDLLEEHAGLCDALAHGNERDAEACARLAALAKTWERKAERQCDELLRTARRALVHECRKHADAVALTLDNELAAAVEQASDALPALSHGLRERAFRRIKAGAA